MSEEELLRWYTNLVYQQTGSYQEVARRLGIDRRTARARIKG
jgi:DNA-binding transcriptional regulator LsrR (DeoR family)